MVRGLAWLAGSWWGIREFTVHIYVYIYICKGYISIVGKENVEYNRVHIEVIVGNKGMQPPYNSYLGYSHIPYQASVRWD